MEEWEDEKDGEVGGRQGEKDGGKMQWVCKITKKMLFK